MKVVMRYTQRDPIVQSGVISRGTLRKWNEVLA